MSNGDVFLRWTLPIKDSPNVPPSNVVIETLVKIAHTMQETPFQWTFIDKPKGPYMLGRPWPEYSSAEMETDAFTYFRSYVFLSLLYVSCTTRC
jgi:hypothetical protein